MSKKVMIVDDSAYMREFIKGILNSAGYEVIGMANDGDSAIEMALELVPDLITLDNVLPDMLGMDIAKILKKEEEISSKIIMISALGQDAAIEECKSHGVDGYIVKPFTEETLLEQVGRIWP